MCRIPSSGLKRRRRSGLEWVLAAPKTGRSLKASFWLSSGLVMISGRTLLPDVSGHELSRCTRYHPCNRSTMVADALLAALWARTPLHDQWSHSYMNAWHASGNRSTTAAPWPLTSDCKQLSCSKLFPPHRQMQPTSIVFALHWQWCWS